jgi:hypothetical protein
MADSDDPPRGGLSTTARLALVAATVVVLVAAFFVARGGGEDEDPSPAAQTAPEATQPPPGGQDPPATATDEDDPGYADRIPRNPKAEEPSVRTVRVRGGAPVGEVRTLSYRRGDRIRLRITADAPDEVHVHGFDVEKPVGPDKPARFNIEADIEGRFEVELHGTGTQIATLEVRPKT